MAKNYNASENSTNIVSILFVFLYIFIFILIFKSVYIILCRVEIYFLQPLINYLYSPQTLDSSPIERLTLYNRQILFKYLNLPYRTYNQKAGGISFFSLQKNLIHPAFLITIAFSAF